MPPVASVTDLIVYLVGVARSERRPQVAAQLYLVPACRLMELQAAGTEPIERRDTLNSSRGCRGQTSNLARPLAVDECLRAPLER